MSDAGSLTDEAPFVFDLHTYEPESKQEIEAATLNLVLKKHEASKLLTGPHAVRPIAVNLMTRGGLLIMKYCVPAVTAAQEDKTAAAESKRLYVSCFGVC